MIPTNSHPLRKWLPIGGYIAMGLSVILLILSPFVDVIGKNLATHTWVGIFLGILAAFVGYFDAVSRKMKQDTDVTLASIKQVANTLESYFKSRESLKHLGLGDAIKYATGRTRYIKHLRIYASTTAVILPIIRDQRLSIEDCEIMIQLFCNDDPNPNARNLNERCRDMVDGWRELAQQQHIKNLRIARYNRYPSEYVIIVDDSVLIHGSYTPTDTSKHGSEYYHPFVVENTEVAAKRLIEDYIKWFDKHFGYFRAKDAEMAALEQQALPIKLTGAAVVPQNGNEAPPEAKKHK